MGWTGDGGREETRPLYRRVYTGECVPASCSKCLRGDRCPYRFYGATDVVAARSPPLLLPLARSHSVGPVLSVLGGGTGDGGRVTGDGEGSEGRPRPIPSPAQSRCLSCRSQAAYYSGSGAVGGVGLVGLVRVVIIPRLHTHTHALIACSGRVCRTAPPAPTPDNPSRPSYCECMQRSAAPNMSPTRGASEGELEGGGWILISTVGGLCGPCFWRAPAGDHFIPSER